MMTNGAVESCSSGTCSIGNLGLGSPTIPYGSAAALGPFRCLSTTDGMVCIVSGDNAGGIVGATEAGFAISTSGITPIFCCVVQAGAQELIAITHVSETNCSEGLHLFDVYLNNPPEQPQGSGGYVKIGAWTCGRNYDAAPGDVRALSCTSSTGTVDAEAYGQS